MKIFALPDLGEGLQEAEIVAWHVAAGDHVVADQPLASVETEKAVVEIPAPHAGHIARLCAQPGERIKVGAPLVEFTEAHADVGALVGELPEAAQPSRAAPAIKAAPAVRALAKRRGVDLASVKPTGPESTITAADVEGAGGPAVAGGEKLSATRRAMAENMARAHAEVAPATINDDADVGEWPPGSDATLRLVQALAAAAASVPDLNAWYDGRAQTLKLSATVDVGIAVDTEAGLIVPVLRDAGRRSPDELRAELARLADGARKRTLKPEELRGATLTLSNFGSLGGRYAQLVVVPPQVAILGAGRIVPAVVVMDGKPAVRRLLPLSLTFDHRAITGAAAARFLNAAIASLKRKN